jgi:O-antigen/teichoic acid export membrane protein
MLSRCAGVATLPIYEIAFTGSMQVRGLIEAAFRALVPEISRIGVDMTIQARDRISQIYRRSMRLIFLLGTPLFAVLAILAPVLLKLWLGDRFVEILPGVLQIMLIGTFLSLLCVPAYYTLMGLGKVHYCLLSHVILSIVNAVVVGIILLSVGTVSINRIALAVVLAMGTTSFYVVWQNRCVMRKLLPGSCAVSVLVPPVSCVSPEA